MLSARRLPVLAIGLMLLLLASQPITATPQPPDDLQPRFNEVIAQLREAEAAGAKPSEVAELLTLLNRALELNEEAVKLTSPNDAQKRAELLAQVDAMLNDVQARASQLETVASQRTYTNTVLAYVSGAIAAVAGTFAYAFLVSFWRRYRIKRTFQMKLIPK